MKYFFVVLLFITPLHLMAAKSENEIKSAVLGKLSHFIKCKTQKTDKNFVITVFQDTEFAKILKDKYAGKQINHKNVSINEIADIEALQNGDLLYIGSIPQELQYELIRYAHENSIVTISEESGFAQRGGIIQLYFVSLKIRFKINNDAAKASKLKISSSLLSISHIVKGETK